MYPDAVNRPKLTETNLPMRKYKSQININVVGTSKITYGEFLDFHSGVVQESILSVRDTALLLEPFPTFRRFVFPSYSRA